MRGCVAGVDFANPLPVVVLRDDRLHYWATDLANPLSVAWHFDPANPRNSVSLTGATHTRQSYDRLPYGWRPAPPGRWTDHYMWEQYFQLEGIAARTSALATTAKFDARAREDMTDQERADEIRAFALRISEPGMLQRWNDYVAEQFWPGRR